MNGRQDAPQTAFHYEWREGGADKKFKTGVSLHGHTWHSHEGLAFLPDTIQGVYFLPRILRWAEKRFERKWREKFDYTLGYWTSPVSPEVAYTLESNQIESQSLRPLVSLTDHDSIGAHADIPSATPISLEWTVPFQKAVFHMGVHNLPPSKANSLLKEMHAYTSVRNALSLSEILEKLNNIPEILIALNHPLSDQGRIGFEIHESMVDTFLDQHGEHIHALEINALQPWEMNRRVTRIANQYGFPVISGGDRHGFEPNGAINLTNASTFDEFVHEIRTEKKSEVLFMDQSKRSLKLRYAESVKAIMDDYPDLPGRVFWHDRVFYRFPDGVVRSMSEMIGKRHAALDVMDLGIGALGLANVLIRPVAPIFQDSSREITDNERE